MEVVFQFAPYGQEFEPRPATLVLDVGLKTIPGIIDHHQPEAEAECAASLVVKHPELVLSHLGENPDRITIITHRLPDFDAVSAIFLSLKLLELRTVDAAIKKIADYARIVDSATIPKNVELSATPYGLLRALFVNIQKPEEEANLERVQEGLRMLRLLYKQASLGRDIVANRPIFQGIDRYEKAMHRVEDDYFSYLEDLEKAKLIQIYLPRSQPDQGPVLVDGLVVQNPKSFLLKEWARRDVFNSPLGRGFSFLLTNLGQRRFIIGVDPEAGVNLKGLGSLLNRLEKEKREKLGRPAGERWYEGNCPFFDYRIIDSPQDGPSLNHREILEAVFDFSRRIKAGKMGTESD
ncbi:MAG: hypothetical protein ACUVRL_04495 [Candidatus Saccharicenans sp.]|uniref:hypothetical protein n=1 Tax=Candidatus Saccharicenans sp. TaxID=2819258 RepID=UPI00404A385E